MRHNQENDYEHRNGDRDHREARREEERERRWREDQRWHEDQRNRRGGGTNQNYPQDRWPDFEESFDSIKNHGRPEHLDDRRREGDYHPNRYHHPDQDPRYLDDEMRARRERRERPQQEDDRHRQPDRNQFASDRWPDEEDTYERRTRPAGDERSREDHEQNRRYYQDRDHDREPRR